ncbi:ParB/RepB/Spo0J family partition protein [Acidobacteriota bacterium]
MPKTKKSGLPDIVKMRHDDHFVELITSRNKAPNIRMIDVEKIDPNPRQARSEIGSIKELMDSIKEKGILEPILIRRKNDRYEIIAGERRYIASKRVKMTEIPCIEMNVEDNEAMEISLIENLQRKDLNPFEEADGLKALADIYGYNHQKIAIKIGKARSTVTEILSIGKIPKKIRDLCEEEKISGRGTLLEVAKLKNEEGMKRLIKEIKERDLKREDTRELSKKIKGSKEREKRFVFNYKSTGKEYYRVRIEFKKNKVNKEEIVKILEEITKMLKYQQEE